jgi:hypothetical protein
MRGSRFVRRRAALVVCGLFTLGVLWRPTGVLAAVTATSGVFGGHTMDGQPIPCVAQPDGVRLCTGDDSGPGGTDLRFKSFDGTPLQVFVTLPPAPASGVDGKYPLIVENHGWGAPPTSNTDSQYGGGNAVLWAKQGYAVLQFAARGWGDSCGNEESRLVNVAACVHGYVHLDDYRYEARDVQYAAGLLVDEGLVKPNAIGVDGESYGAGVSLELATLNDRVMNADGSLSRWVSPEKRIPLHIAAAAPFAGWSDLVYSLAPNGRTLDTQIASPSTDISPVGVVKQSILSGLYGEGMAGAYFAPPGVDPQADAIRWFLQSSAGEPYTTPGVQTEVQQMAEFRSPYYLLQGDYGMKSEAPSPLLWTNGFTDDIFPVDEALRYYNLERRLYPHDPISLQFGDIGHQRADDKTRDLVTLLMQPYADFFDYYLKGVGKQPASNVTAMTQTCPVTVASDGPFVAKTWADLHPGEVDYRSDPAQTILSAAGDAKNSVTFDTIGASEMSNVDGQGWACQTVSANPEQGVATYRLPAATGNGYTLLGAPVVTADLTVTGEFPYVAARLLDVDPATNTATLIARGVYRLDPNAPNGRQTFQLHEGAWHFAAGHIPELELLGRDAPYLRPSNGTFTIEVSDLELQLPVHDIPGAAGVPAVVTP